MCLLNCTNDHTALSLSSNESCELFGEGSTSVKCVIVFAYSLIMLISLFGNLAVIAIVSRNKRMWTTTNYLIASMAASDLLISVFAVPREIGEIFSGPRRWLVDGLAGLILCKLVYFFQDISAAVSIQSLVVIAIDRYRGIVFPLRPPIITSKVCKIIIPITWIVAMCIHGTYFYTLRLVMLDNKWYCTFSWTPKFDERPTQERYFLFVSVLLIFLPLCAILTLYALIVIELKKRKTNVDGASGLRRQRQKEDAAIVKKIHYCIRLYYFVWDWHATCGLDKLFSAAKFIFYSNASLNPCVYIILNEKYRHGIKGLVTCLSSKRTDGNDIEMV